MAASHHDVPPPLPAAFSGLIWYAAPSSLMRCLVRCCQFYLLFQVCDAFVSVCYVLATWLPAGLLLM
jgi:hypothetical protein